MIAVKKSRVCVLNLLLIHMAIGEITFGTPAFDEALVLRDKILRQPLKLKFHTADIEQEWQEIHLGSYDDVNGMLLGCLSLRIVDDHTLKMRQVAVAVAAQGKGIGRQLVIAAEAWGRQQGYDTMKLHARETAVPFYEKLNYQTLGDRFYEVNLPHFAMEKKI